MSRFTIRDIEQADLRPLAKLWHAQWTTAHSQYVPKALTLVRTIGDFERRLRAFGDKAKTSGDIGKPIGFCAISGAELDQIYVDPNAPGSGLASALLDDGEARIAAQGYAQAYLVCIKENLRAQSFYRRQGWTPNGEKTAMLATSNGDFPLECLSFVKTL